MCSGKFSLHALEGGSALHAEAPKGVDALSATDTSITLSLPHRTQCSERLVTALAGSVAVCQSYLSLQVGQGAQKVSVLAPLHHLKERGGNCHLLKS